MQVLQPREHASRSEVTPLPASPSGLTSDRVLAHGTYEDTTSAACGPINTPTLDPTLFLTHVLAEWRRFQVPGDVVQGRTRPSPCDMREDCVFAGLSP